LARNLRLRFNGNRVGVPLPASRKAIRQLLTQELFDIIHVSVPHSPLLSGRVIRAVPKQVPVVGTFMILPLAWLTKWGGKILGLFQRRAMRRFTEIMAVSQPASEFSQFMYGRPGIVTGNPVDLTPFHTARTRATQIYNSPSTGPVKVL